ncbi:MAG: adenosine deaminase, partial [Lachnospiraceae bacterium]|nr:adenosine deaminase [Lachnospiraceae bacterium]
GITDAQRDKLEKRRKEAEEQLKDSPLTGRHLERRIDDFTFINFSDLILGNPDDALYNIERIRNSLTIPKDGQAVFADLEKVYLYRYVFTKGVEADYIYSGINIENIPDREVHKFAEKMLEDRRSDNYCRNTLYQDLLLWIAREYKKHGIEYAEITDTALLHRNEFPDRLRQIHEVMPSVTRETGVQLRFLAGIRRTPLTIIRDRATPVDYLADNLCCLRVIAGDPYVAGSDIVGEEINDILELKGMLRELVKIAGETPGFVIRIHAGENDSLPDNVANSIMCVADALKPGQRFPNLRIGHGLYTCDLNSEKGKKLLEEIRRNDVTLEFQLTSNVRLNNLSTMEKHPLKQYLRAGVNCVQGTDGGALYGTNSIDEELSLEKLLGLSFKDLCRMRESEDRILNESRRIFEEKYSIFRENYPGGDLELFYRNKLSEAQMQEENLWHDPGKIETARALGDRIRELPKGKIPIVIAGGSFNNARHRTVLKDADKRFLDELIEKADPEKVFFAVGHSLKAHEGYLVKKAAGRFDVIAVVPNMLTRTEEKRLAESDAGIIISIESSGMGLYKTFAYEIFKRMPSVLLVFDGNSAALNLIQEAKNVKGKSSIFINKRSRDLAAKAATLKGYVQPMPDADSIIGLTEKKADK